MIPVVLAPEAKEDLKRLSPHLQKVSIGWMSRLRKEPKLGKHLEWRRGADLRRCWKLYFDEDDEPLKLLSAEKRPKRPDGPRFRIVYLLIPDDTRPHRVLVLAIGKKRNGVYEAAAKRLND